MWKSKETEKILLNLLIALNKMKKDVIQQLEDYKNDGFIDLDDMIMALGNWMSTKDLREFLEFIEDEYVK